MNRNLHNLNQLMKNINLKNLLCGPFKKPILILSLFSFRLFRLPEESWWTYRCMSLVCCGTPPHSPRCPSHTRPCPRSRPTRPQRTRPSRSTPTIHQIRQKCRESIIFVHNYFLFLGKIYIHIMQKAGWLLTGNFNNYFKFLTKLPTETWSFDNFKSTQLTG